jgi:hypothetical protein
MRSTPTGKPSAIDRCRAAIETFLAGGRKPAAEVAAAILGQGFSRATFLRCKSRFFYHSKQPGSFCGPWWMEAYDPRRHRPLIGQSQRARTAPADACPDRVADVGDAAGGVPRATPCPAAGPSVGGL